MGDFIQGTTIKRVPMPQHHITEFRKFVSEQPADKHYHYVQPQECAFAQYLRSKRIPCRVSSTVYWDTSEPWKRYVFDPSVADALSDFPWEFGALKQRLDAVLGDEFPLTAGQL